MTRQDSDRSDDDQDDDRRQREGFSRHARLKFDVSADIKGLKIRPGPHAEKPMVVDRSKEYPI